MEGGDSRLTINGGYIAVDALGDGIDINGTVEMTGGIVLVNGPTANNNGALDHEGSRSPAGSWWPRAARAWQRLRTPPPRSMRWPILSRPRRRGTLVHIETNDGQEVLTFAPTKTFQSIVISSPS